MGDKAGGCSSPRDCPKPAATSVPAPATKLGVRSGGVPPHGTGEPPWALAARLPGNGPAAGARVPATASRRKSLAQVVPCWIRHLHGNPPAQAVRAREMPSPRKRGGGGGAGRDAPVGHRAPGAGGLGGSGRPRPRGDGGEPDPLPGPRGAEGSGGQSPGHPQPRHGGRREGATGGERCCP